MPSTASGSPAVDQSHPLDGFRAEINQVDEQLLALLRRRLEICVAIAGVKRDHGIPMMQEDRVAEVRARFSALAEGNGLTSSFAQHLYDVILAEACRVEDVIMAPDSPVPLSVQPHEPPVKNRPSEGTHE
jgi:4-amino-4-deoxychorismate mutase